MTAQPAGTIQSVSPAPSNLILGSGASAQLPGSTLLDGFQHLLAYLIPVAETTELNSAAAPAGEALESPREPAPKRASSGFSEPPDSAEPAWFLVPIWPAAQIPAWRPLLEFGRELPQAASRQLPESLAAPAAQAIPASGHRGPASPEPMLALTVSQAPPPTAPAVASGSPVVIEGWLRDRKALPEEPALERPAGLRPVGARLAAANGGVADLQVESPLDVLEPALPGDRGDARSQEQGADERRESDHQPPSRSGHPSQASSGAMGTNAHSNFTPPGSEGRANRSPQPAGLPGDGLLAGVGEPGEGTSSTKGRALTVRLQEILGRPVSLHFAEANGEVRVTVRTGDDRLATALARELPGFEFGLESRGWSASLRSPHRSSEPRSPLEYSGPAREVHHADAWTPAMDQPRHEHDPADGPGTNWEEEAEDRSTAAALRRLAIAKERT